MADLNEQIIVLKGDITKVAVDVIVNAANTSLMGGGGVDGAIHRTGGTAILEDCRKIIARQGSCKVGHAVYTNAGNLPCKYAIHTVGPVWNGGGNREAELLANAYFNALKLAIELGCNSIAFPNISTGIYKFPKILAAEIALKVVTGFLKESNENLKVYFVCFDDDNFELYKSMISKRESKIDQIKAALFGLSVGDALGVPVEFKSRKAIVLNPVEDMTGYGTYNLEPGTWSDDSSLAFCLTESLTRGYDLQDAAILLHLGHTKDIGHLEVECLILESLRVEPLGM